MALVVEKKMVLVAEERIFSFMEKRMILVLE
jgi:hypothetical protein